MVHEYVPKVGTKIETSLTKMLGIQHPIMLAGMNVAAGPELAAAVTNAGGIGVIGGLGYTPKMLRRQIDEIKSGLVDKNAPFGIDLLLPKVGDGARKTNHDYTNGQLPELIDTIIEGGAKLFVCAVGVPPKWAVEKLHAAGIVCMNMVGAPHHVAKALDVGMDMICAQGTEAGGHTGDIATLPLIPQCVDACKGRSNFFGKPVPVVGAGGFYDGRGLGAALCLGATGVWVGTRFIASEEANAGPVHQKRIVECTSNDTTRIEAFTGRPCRVLRTDYVKNWEGRTNELKDLLQQGRVPFIEAIEAGTAQLSQFYPALT